MNAEATGTHGVDMKNFAMLSFGRIRLLIPQENVATVEACESIVIQPGVSGAVGRLQAEGAEWPVFVLNENFEARAECPPSYRFCIAVSCRGEAAFALACEDVSKISIANDSGFVPLHACMRLPQGPILSLLPRNGKLVMLSDAEALWHYLVQEEAA